MSDIRGVLQKCLPAIDDDTLDYFESMIQDTGYDDRETLKESLAPFIEGYGFAADLDAAGVICDDLCDNFRNMGISGKGNGDNDEPVLLDKAVHLQETISINPDDREFNDNLWGFAAVRKSRNTIMEENVDAGSAR
jgi:hypothetical protein